MVTEPTRVTNNSSSLLDVLITSRPDQFKDFGILDITLSDHYPTYDVMNMLGTRHIKHRIITTRSWSEGAVDSFRADLETAPWSVIDSFDNIDDMCSTWESLMRTIIDRHFPSKRKRVRKKTHPWLDSNVLRIMRSRDRVHKKAKR